MVGPADADARPADRPGEGQGPALADQGKNNEQLRQEFLSIYVPRIRELGLRIPDPELRLDEATGRWQYTEPDWAELRRSSPGTGRPRSRGSGSAARTTPRPSGSATRCSGSATAAA